MNLRGSKKVDAAILAQIENGVSAKQYLQEGALVMHDVFQLIEQLKQGNYNNYIGDNNNTSPGSNANKGELHTKRSEDNHNSHMLDNQSMISKSVVSQTVKAKRILQIKRLEKEF